MVRIMRASVVDAQEILELQKLAYLDEAAIYDDYTIAPLHQSLAEMEQDMRQQIVLKAVEGEGIVGSVRGHARDGTCFIGRLIVHPDFQNRGIGRQLVAEIEGCFAGIQRYELFTGQRSQKNLHLYLKLGYRPLRMQRFSDKVTLVYLEKVIDMMSGSKVGTDAPSSGQ